MWEPKFLAEIMAGRDPRILPTTQPAAEHLTVEKWRALPAFVPVETKELRRDNGRQLRRSSLRQGVSEDEWRALQDPNLRAKTTSARRWQVVTLQAGGRLQHGATPRLRRCQT